MMSNSSSSSSSSNDNNYNQKKTSSSGLPQEHWKARLARSTEALHRQGLTPLWRAPQPPPFLSSLLFY